MQDGQPLIDMPFLAVSIAQFVGRGGGTHTVDADRVASSVLGT